MASRTPGICLIRARKEIGIGWVIETLWCVTRRSAWAGFASVFKNSAPYIARKTPSRHIDTAKLAAVRILRRRLRKLFFTISAEYRNIVVAPVCRLLLSPLAAISRDRRTQPAAPEHNWPRAP